MSGRNWLCYAALGGCLAAFLGVYVGLAQEAQSPREAPAQSEQPTAKDAEPEPSPQAAPAKKEKTPADPKQPASKSPDYYPKADLAAQERMAFSTEELVVLTERQNVITAIEAGLLGITIFFTAWASIAAARAAKAADRAVEVTEDTARRQLRAYVMPSKTTLLFREDRCLEVVLHIENAGQTPASDLIVLTRLLVTPTHETVDFSALAKEKTPFSRTSIGPRVVTTINNSTPVPLADAYVLQIEKGGVIVYCWGTIHYKDVFGDPQTTKFRYQFSGKKLQPKNAMIYCDQGNEAT